MLQRWPELRLISLIAPAGFGKSSLAAAWTQSLADLPDDRRPAVAWLPLFSDIDAAQFLHRLIAALQPVLPSLQALLASADSGELPPLQAARTLAVELTAATRPIVLVIDDVHLLTDPAAHALIQQLLDHPSDCLHLVLLTRTTPPLRLAQLILDDAVLTLTERDLAFDHDEFLAFAALTGIDSQPAPVLDDLERRCSGWVTGLKLLSYDLLHPPPAGSRARLVLLDSPDAENAVQHFLESRVLAQLPTDLRDFALAAAPLPWMSAELMAAASAMPVALCVQRLADLAAAVGFVSEFEHAGQLRFRFHPLVHDALRRIAAAHQPQRPSLSHAAAWLCDHDEVDEALALMDSRPLTADGRPQSSPLTLYSDSPLLPAVSGPPSAVDFLDSLARAVRRALLRFDLTSVGRWLDALPHELLASHASLAVDAAWHAFFVESVPLLDAALPRAVAALRAVTIDPAGPADTPADDPLRQEVAFLTSYHHLLHERIREADHALAEAEALPVSQDTLGRGYLHLMRCLRPLDSSDVDARIRALQSAADIFERIGFDFGVIQMMFTQAATKRMCGDLAGALADSLFLQGFAENRDRARHTIVMDDLRQRGEILYTLDRIDEARRAMQNLLAVCINDDGHHTQVYVARTYLALCDAAQATDPRAALAHIDLIDDAARWVHVLDAEFSGNQGYIAWPRILRDYRAGRFERCWQTVESLRLMLDDISDQMHDTLRLAVLGGAVLGRREEPQIAALLDDFLHYLKIGSCGLMSQQVRLLRVLHAQHIADDDLALAHLQELLPHVERSGAVRLLLDFPELLPLLQRCDSPFAARLAHSMQPARSIHEFGLTPQETRILEMIVAGRSTKEIAAAHTLSQKTIYSHLQNVFQKLGVHSRAEAVRAAREMGIGGE